MTMQLDAVAADLDEVLKAVANPVRRHILNQLKDPEHNFPLQDHSYDHGVCAGKIDDVCQLSHSTVSAHLAILQHANLVTTRRVGQYNFYKRNEPAIAAFLEHLEQSL
jgi:DNA-binding transcriptional ArsR family regulator